MNALDAGFGFNVTDCGKTLSLRQGEHIRIYPTGHDEGFGEQLTARQVDLIRIATAVHVADGWVRRRAAHNGLRSPTLDVEVLDTAFWSRPETVLRLKDCVDFLSGGDDWSFRFVRSANARHDRRVSMFRGNDRSALVSLYSGGLDSAAGLAARLAAEPGRMAVPVTVRHQMQKAQLIGDHFRLLVRRGVVARGDLMPFQAGAFVRNRRIKSELGVRLREITHRCRPLLFMTLAGLVADTLAVPAVEVFESGVGSVNLPLVSGPADYRTTRSTHPNFLRLVSALVSHVNEAQIEYVLPFAGQTKAEMVARVRELGLEELAQESVSCILHPLLRRGWQQCGHCPACVYRRQAMLTAGIAEAEDAYAVDLFSPPHPRHPIPLKQLRPIRAFHQQVARLSELDDGLAPECLRRYLLATRAISSDEQLAQHVEVHRRYRREWLDLIADARRHGLPWLAPSLPPALAPGAIP